MSTIRYIHRAFHFDPDGSRLTVSYDHNPLAPDPGGSFYENHITHIDPDNTILTRFDCGYTHKPEWFTIRDRVLPRLLFKYVLSGSLDYNGKTMQQGDLAFLEAGVPTDLCPHPGGVEALWCVWEGEMMDSVVSKLGNFRQNTVYHLPGVGAQLTALFAGIIYNPCLEMVDFNRFVAGFTDSLLAYLPAIDASVGRRSVGPLVARAQGIIDCEYKSITIEALAARLYVDPCHLARAFRREADMTPKQYLTRTRLTYAEFYLANTDTPITQIAEAVGYAGYTAFYLAFKRAYGIPPEEYRRGHRRHDG